MIYLIIYLSIGFGVWLGLSVLRYNKGGYPLPILVNKMSYIRGFIGSLVVWPILLFFVEP